jgi:hypothetical protein
MRYPRSMSRSLSALSLVSRQMEDDVRITVLRCLHGADHQLTDAAMAGRDAFLARQLGLKG